MNFGDERLPSRFWNKCAPCPMSGCWLWTGASDGQGYGKFKLGTPSAIGAHRVVFAASGRVLGDGRRVVIDHLCRVECCVNPVHLEQVTQRQNVRRGRRGLLTNACPNGHPYTVENRYVRPVGSARAGRSHCRLCNGSYFVQSTPAAEAWVDARKAS